MLNIKEALGATFIEKRVQNGVKVLDNYDPEWFNKIDLELLNLGNCMNCVLGQLFEKQWEQYSRSIKEDINNPYSYGKNNLFHGNNDYCIIMSIHCGFSSYNDEIYPELTDEWERVVLERRKSSQVSVAEEELELATC